jgi:hypothetical protein
MHFKIKLAVIAYLIFKSVTDIFYRFSYINARSSQLREIIFEHLLHSVFNFLFILVKRYIEK